MLSIEEQQAWFRDDSEMSAKNHDASAEQKVATTVRFAEDEGGSLHGVDILVMIVALDRRCSLSPANGRGENSRVASRSDPFVTPGPSQTSTTS